MTNNIQFLSNEKIGRLMAIKPLNKNDCRNRAVWLFKCECGNETEGSASDVRLHRKTSCGCSIIEYRKRWGQRLTKILTKPNHDGPRNKLFGTYKRMAIKRGYVWQLTKNEFGDLIKENCFYCGCVPSTGITNSRTKTNVLYYNGIDRKNNLLGYNYENCITACGKCNRMKMNLPYDEYMNTIKVIYERHFKKT